MPLKPVRLLTLALLLTTGSALAQSGLRPVKIGFVNPETGPFASFGQADAFVVKNVAAQMSKVLGRQVQIIVRDSQSDPKHAASVAADLIQKDKVDLMLTASGPDNVIPVSDQCEANRVPCISTLLPWQVFYYRNPKVGVAGYQYTFHFFWGIEDTMSAEEQMWGALPTNKVVGALWPNDPDGAAFSAQRPSIEKLGYSVVDPGRFDEPDADFSTQIAAFKKAGVQIVTAVLIPPDLKTFMVQARQQGFTPRLVTVHRAAQFPADIESIGDGLGAGIGTEGIWTPAFPYSSSLTGQSDAQLAAAYSAETGKQWTQVLGYVHALFEVATDVLRRAPSLDRAALVSAIRTTRLNTAIGPVAWGQGPNPNVAKTQLTGVQWVKGTAYPFDLVITAPNSTAIPTGSQVQPTSWK